MDKFHNVAIVAADTEKAAEAKIMLLSEKSKATIVRPNEADLVVVLGGDGAMIQLLHNAATGDLRPQTAIMGFNLGRAGFLMNPWHDLSLDEVVKRAQIAQKCELPLLRAVIEREDGSTTEAFAVNEVSMMRESSQAARLQVLVDGVDRTLLFGDGVLVSTPAGSTAYNQSAGGPLLALGLKALSLTPLNPIEPRRWQGAVLSDESVIKFVVDEPEKRPVFATADHRTFNLVRSVEVSKSPQTVNVLYDAEHGLQDRIAHAQFN